MNYALLTVLICLQLSAVYERPDQVSCPSENTGKDNAKIATNDTQVVGISILQKAIDSAQDGAIIKLPKGIYKGKIRITKPLTIDGIDKNAIIQGSGVGSVIEIRSSNVTLKNLTIRGSGSEHNSVDSAVSIKDSFFINILNNHIEDTLFGIDFDKVNQSKIEDNFITSKPVALGLRGDAIRMWYSNENSIARNKIYKSRDTVIWYSSGNRIEDNVGSYCRYSLHFMYAGKNVVQNNFFEHNSVGIFFMYSNGSTAIGNTIKNSIGSFGIGIGMKDTSNFKLYNNTLTHNARGLYIDQSPYQPGSVNIFEKNNILYNSIGVQFHGTTERSLFYGNNLKGNMETVINDTPQSKIYLNEWSGNYFDDYEGFDRDKDGIGDIPYVNKAYADKLWLYNNGVKFFYGSPVMSLLNFLAKLIPFSEPDLLVKDDKPRIRAKYDGAK
jgi:nitrous oxidase accessory protein